jgi:hypothetical protein
MQPPDSQSGQRWNAIRSHVRTYDLLALQTFSLLRETGVCLKVLSDSFRRKFIHVTPNRAYAVCKSFTVRTVTLYPSNELQVNVLHEHQILFLRNTSSPLLWNSQTATNNNPHAKQRRVRVAHDSSPVEPLQVTLLLLKLPPDIEAYNEKE